MEYLSRVLGNGPTRNRIGAAIHGGRLPHALLIDGARGSGKMTLALEISAALNCKGKTDTLPCGECNTCQLIRRGEFIDVKVLQRQEDKMTIGVSEIKDFRRDMFLSATEADYKVYIIQNAERMTPEAQNALLKVLEEPPARVVIMLLAEGTDRILTTIKSRAQYITMARFSRDVMRDYIIEHSTEGAMLSHSNPKRLEVILTESDGVIGRALELLSTSSSLGTRQAREDALSFVEAISNRSDYSKLLSAISSLPTSRTELTEVLEEIMLALRDMIAVKNAQSVKTLFFTSETEAADACENKSIRYLLAVYDLINNSHSKLQKNVGVTALLAELTSQIKLI